MDTEKVFVPFPLFTNTTGIIFELKLLLLINAIGQNGHFLKKCYIQQEHYNFHILPQSDLKHDHAETVCSILIN